MRRLLWLWCALGAVGCEPAPLLVLQVDAGAVGDDPAPSRSSAGTSSGGTAVWSGTTSTSGSASAASSAASSSSAPSSSGPPVASGPLLGELAFPVAMQAGFYRVNTGGMTSEFRVWMADAAGRCPELEDIHPGHALNITFGTREEGAAVTPGTYAVVPLGAPLPPMQPYASVWGWWNPASQLSFVAMAGSVEVTQASPTHVAGTFDVLMDRRDGSAPSALGGAFETSCVQPVP